MRRLAAAWPWAALTLVMLGAERIPWGWRTLTVLSACAATVWWEGRRVEKLLGDLRARVQDASLRVVNSNIQLLSVRELWQALAKPGQAQQFLESALSFCHRGAGFSEVAILRIEPASEELVGMWLRSGGQGAVIQNVRWALAGVGGGVARAIRSCRTTTSDGAERAPLLTINGEAPEPGREATEFFAVPILSPMPRPECRTDAWLYRKGCPAYTPSSLAGRRPGVGQGRARLDLSPCLGCRHFPVHGVLLATDAAGAKGLRRSDQLTLESIAYAVGSLLENSSLYAEVKDAERFRDHILDGMTNGLITTDAAGRVVFVNRQAQRMRGEAMSRLAGRRLEELFEFPGGPLPVRRVLLEERAMLHQEALLRRAAPTSEQGQPAREPAKVPVRVSLAPFQPQQGAAPGAVCVFEDLSSVRAMEDEIRHLDTLAAIGRFASSLAHEVRNPLGGIGAGVGYLARSRRLTEEDLQYVERIQHEVDRLDRTIRALLAVARPTSLQLTEERPQEVVTGAVETLRPWARERGVELHLRCADDVPQVHLDRDLVHQLLVNLVKNAIEASPRGAAVDVEVTRTDVHAPNQSESGAHSREGVAVAVVDRGCGIAKEDLPRLFEPFHSRKAEGTGLGLFACHGIAQRHGGSIQVKSSPDEGSRFTVALPRFPALMGASHEAEHSHR